MLAFIFPGQGSQAKGMGKALAEAFPVARQTFQEADDALGMNLSAVCFEGSEDDLKKTEITQPAILTTSTAMHRVLREVKPDLVPSFGAGHSLGEWSALVAAGAFRFADAVRLVRDRGRFMQTAVPLGEGSMCAVIAATDVVLDACKSVEAKLPNAIVRAANFNGPEQTVISGAAFAVEAAVKMLSQLGAKLLHLPVSAPFHCPLMEPAAKELERELVPVELGLLRFPIVTNVEAKPNQEFARVKKLLVEQVTAPVRWVETVRFLAEAGVTEAIEIGPGKVLAGLVRRIDKNIKVTNVADLLKTSGGPGGA